MNALFVANIEMGENEGIYKKVVAESAAIGRILGKCNLVTKFNGKAKVKKHSGESLLLQKTVLDYVYDCVTNKLIDFLYIRNMIPSPKLVALLRLAKKNGIQIYYEIPTYPYYWEQFKASRRKYRAVIKIGLDVIFWPVIYHYIDKLVVIRSSTKAKSYPKMIEINNGVKVDNIQSKTYSVNDTNVFRMVTMGTLFPYHGYDRILKGMSACEEKVGNVKVEFHIVGSSQTIDELHCMANDLKLRNVVFHGMKTTEELNNMYEEFDVGLGCLALHRRHADIDTTLKVVEYFCRGIPVISTGQCPLTDKRFFHMVEDSENPIDIADIYNYYKGLEVKDLQTISEIAKHHFSWENIMKTCLKDVI